MKRSYAEKPIDYKQVELFGQCNLPEEDMAVLLGLPLRRVKKLMNFEKSKFYKFYRKGQAVTRFNLLHQQIATALGTSSAKGNPAMLMRLGESMLGQENGKNKKQEEKQVIAEAIVENATETQKIEAFGMLIGISDAQSEIIDT